MTEASDTTVIDDNELGHAEIYAGTRFEETSSSDYTSNHKVNAQGLAKEGTFEAHSSRTEQSTEFDDRVGHVWLVFEDLEDDVVDNHHTTWVKTTHEVHENGSYQDLALSEGLAIRLQSATYDSEDKLESATLDEHNVREYLIGGQLDQIDDERELAQDTWTTTTEGSYSPYGGSETKDVAYDHVYRYLLLTTYPPTSPEDQLYTETHRKELLLHTADGVTTGHEYERQWRDINGTITEWIDPIIDRDLFETTAPPPAPQAPPTVSTTPGAAESLFLTVSDVTPELPAPSSGGFWSVPDAPEVKAHEAPATVPQAEQPSLGFLSFIFSPIRSPREWARGVELDRTIDERRLVEAQKEMALHPGSNQGLDQLRAIQQQQRRQAADEATAFAEFDVNFNAMALGGGFLRPGGGNFGKPQKAGVAASSSNRAGLRQAMGEPPAGMLNPQAHHDLPWTFRDWFAQRGLNVNDPRFGRWVQGTPPGGHQRWTAAFEAEWRDFIGRFPNADRQQAIDFMNQLRLDPRFQ